MGYRDFSQFLATHFPHKMQKLTVNAGCSCPNRDGTKGYGGCTYCNNQSFNPAYCTTKSSITSQLEEGKRFFGKKYSDMHYLAYFQAYTNTYGEIDTLMTMYREALAVDNVDGIIIGTRPDCVPQPLLDELAALHRSKWVMLEYGAETAHDETLRLINRCHSWEDTINAVMRTVEVGIPVGLHLIIGLPGETEAMVMETIDKVSHLPVSAVKLHQLQLIHGTRMATDIENGLYDIPHFSVEKYMDLCCKIIQHISPTIAIERFVSQSPDNLLVAPRWGLKNYEFTNLLDAQIRKMGIQQGEPIQN